MGIYINPGNSGFQEVVLSEYVDKTGLINLINQTIGTKSKLTCISRPRRFGKSFATQMLCAYYDCSCDSSKLFSDKEISRTKRYLEHLNKYNVINLDITGFISEVRSKGLALETVPSEIVRAIHKDLKAVFPEYAIGESLTEDLIYCAEKTGRKFVFIIDEWDALIREAKSEENIHREYLNLLRGWFKNNNFTSRVVAAAYMTGILPIKKDGSQSAISDFREYSILNPEIFAEYTGFTENEVKELCERHNVSFDEAKKWYDGYDFQNVGAIYNPYSVMQAVNCGKFGSYWKKTSAAESLLTYINMDFDGLQEIIARLISGEKIEVETDSFENDFESFKSRDDVLTLLIHLGYLTWDDETKMAHIPNEEVCEEFKKIIKSSNVSNRWVDLIESSKKIIKDTLEGKADEVAGAIEKLRDSQYAPTFYNDEQALRYVIKFAYIAALEQYIQIEELPSGHGIADVVFLPRKMSRYPAMVIELKWNKSSDGAIRQIKEKNYPEVLKEFGEELLLVGINYDEKTKRHSCCIEEA